VQHAKLIGQRRQRRAFRVRNKLKRHSTRPRLCVFRSLKHIYAQIIDDNEGRVLAAAGTRDKEIREQIAYGGNAAAAAAVGRAIAERAVAAGVTKVALDRREYKYHGRVAALADAARDAGLDLGAKKEVVEAVEKAPEPEKKKKDKDKTKAKEGKEKDKGKKKKEEAPAE
jgi:large subunit ribosomal protein L18